MNVYTKLLSATALIGSMAVGTQAHSVPGTNYSVAWNAVSSLTNVISSVDLLSATTLNLNGSDVFVNNGVGYGFSTPSIQTPPLNPYLANDQITLPTTFTVAASAVNVNTSISGFTASWSDGLGGEFTFNETSGYFTRGGQANNSSISFYLNGYVCDSATLVACTSTQSGGSYSQGTGSLATQTASFVESVTYNSSAAGTTTGTSINFSTPVPEPISMSLFGLGVVGLAAVRRRR